MLFEISLLFSSTRRAATHPAMSTPSLFPPPAPPKSLVNFDIYLHNPLSRASVS